MRVELEYVLEVLVPDMCQCDDLHPRVWAFSIGADVSAIDQGVQLKPARCGATYRSSNPRGRFLQFCMV